MPTLEEFRGLFLEKVDAFNRRDWDGMVAGLPDSFEWHFPGEVVDRPDPVRPGELREAVVDLVSQFPNLQAEPLEIVEGGPGAFVVRLLVQGAGAASGASIRLEFAQLWEYEGEEPARVREFMSVSDALAKARQ